MFEDKGRRLHGWQERTWQSRVNNVVRDDLDVGEPLMRSPLHQFVLAHPDVAAGVAEAPAERPDEIFKQDLGVPVVRLRSEELAARLQQPVERRQGLGVEVMTQ